MTADVKKAAEPLIRIENLKKYFNIRGKGELHAVDDISFDIMPQETVGLVGESGCGKSTVGNMLLQLTKPTGGKVIYQGMDLFKSRNAEEMRALRREIQIVFQDPYSSLNPKQRVRTILEEPFKIHKLCSGAELEARVRKMALMAGLEEYMLDCYPHELDGGRRQMVGIARALSLDPKFIVCDEPVSALDVSVQATIINLLMDLQKKLGLTYLFISHDLSVVRHISNRVVVMYLGQIVEMAETDVIFDNPVHPYTIALLSAVPKVEFENQEKRIVLKGDVPSPLNPRPGCRFAQRCWMACEECSKKTPGLVEVEPGHFAACPYWSESQARKARIQKERADQEL